MTLYPGGRGPCAARGEGASRPVLTKPHCVKCSTPRRRAPPRPRSSSRFSCAGASGRRRAATRLRRGLPTRGRHTAPATLPPSRRLRGRCRPPRRGAGG
ncbi:MAG TPA: hypothetical protein DER32_06440 [Deinococcus radiodurans]|nr:hypothetical protein [Deinococcus radiodurans]